MISVAYYSIMFILALYLIGRIISNIEQFRSMDESYTRGYSYLCVEVILLCLCSVVVGVSASSVVDKIALYCCEFLRLIILISGAQLCGVVTDKKVIENRVIHVVTSELLYLGITALVARTILDKAATRNGLFGTAFVSGNRFGLVGYITVYVLILFIYAAYTYMFYYSRTRKREGYLFKGCVSIVAVLTAGLFIEAFGQIEFGEYIPTVNIGIIVSLLLFRNMLQYRRKIEYNEEDYDRILVPSYTTPAFVCDDQGVIIFENVRAFVMKQTYKEKSYIGSYLTDLFEITEYDKERLKDSRITQEFDVYCRYSKEPKEVLLKVRHNIDRYGEIFSTEVEYTTIEDNEEVLISSDGQGTAANIKELRLKIIYEELNKLRLNSLIKLLEAQKMLYETDQQILFELNLRGIIKSAECMSMPALVELCERIQDAVVYSGEWETLDSMIINLDRQYETLKMLV